jgi:hypothetical protein
LKFAVILALVPIPDELLPGLVEVTALGARVPDGCELLVLLLPPPQPASAVISNNAMSHANRERENLRSFICVSSVTVSGWTKVSLLCDIDCAKTAPACA